MSDSNQQNELVANSVCRFCLLKNEKREFYRIPSYEWPDSPLAAMYESVMKHQVINYVLRLTIFTSTMDQPTVLVPGSKSLPSIKI